MSLNILGQNMAETVNRLSTTARALSDTATSAASAMKGSATSTTVYSSDMSTISSTDTSVDTRIRLKAQQTSVYGDGISSLLRETNGLLFPYTPTIQVSQDVNYAAMQMTHSNTDYHSYTNTPNVTISLTGKFTVQNAREGRYALAALHFLRTASKMYFGEKDVATGRAGLPPPVLLLEGYGTYMFNNIKVILRGHNYSFDENVDTVAVAVANGSARIPAIFTISLSLVAQQTPTAMRKEFSLDEFRSGALLEKGGWL